jgi:hypothetical protein
MSSERISPNAIPDGMLATVGVMNHALRSMSSIETVLSKVMQLGDLDPRLRSEMEYVCDAGSAVSVSLALMRMTVKEVLKEVAKNQASDCKPVGDVRRNRAHRAKTSRRLEIAERVLRQRYPMCSASEIRNRAAYLAARINSRAPSKAMEDALVMDVETGLHKTPGFHFRHEPKAIEKESKFVPFTIG